MTRTFNLGAALRCPTLAGVAMAASALAQRHYLTLQKRTVNINGADRLALTVNGQFPGPLLRLRKEAVVRVTRDGTVVASAQQPMQVVSLAAAHRHRCRGSAA